MGELQRLKVLCVSEIGWLDSATLLADIKGGETDVALRFGHGRYPGLSSRLLMKDWYYPVCSPEFITRHQLASPEQLVGLPLLRPYGPGGAYQTRAFAAISFSVCARSRRAMTMSAGFGPFARS